MSQGSSSGRALRAAVTATLATSVIVALSLFTLTAQAGAENPNPLGAGLTPVLGWSSWSSFRHTSTAAIDEANAQAMVSSGLAAVGYSSINQDDGWYACPRVHYTGATADPGVTDGPTVNTFGQWVTSQTTTSNTGAFPNEGTENGMEVLGDYIHSLGLKFGIYLTPGISGNAIYLNTAVENNQDGELDGTASSYTADEITENYPQGTTLTPADYSGTLVTANNYNCGGTWELNYTSPGAQLFVDSEADEFASWGVNFVKLDGITDTNTKDVAAWSEALNQTGTPIDLDITEGTFTISIATTLDEYATQWEYSPDIESGSNLTTYQSAYIRFNTDAIWQSKGGAGKGFNDDDSVEIGDGCSTLPTGSGSKGDATCPGATAGAHGNDGLTLPAEETVLSLWSLASSPLILGATLQVLHDNPVTLALLTNKQVLGVDQDSIDASRVEFTPNEQVFTKTQPTGKTYVGLFNTNYTEPEVVSVPASALGLPAGDLYQVQTLYGDDSDICMTQESTAPLCPATATTSFETAGTISASVPPEGVALYEVTPISNPAAAPPETTLSLSGLSTLTAGEATTAVETFTNNGAQAAQSVQFSLSAPAGWTVTPTSSRWVGQVASGQQVHATFRVTAPTADTTGTVSAADSFTNAGNPAVSTTVTAPVRVVAAPVEINEVQTGTATTPNQQFIELYNPGTAPVSISGWQLEYRNATSAFTRSSTLLATVPASTTIPAHGFYLIGGAGYVSAGTTPADNLSFTQTSTTELTTIGGGVAIVDTNGFTIDSVAWGVNTNTTYPPSAFQRSSNAFVQSCPAQANGAVPTVSSTTINELKVAPTPPSIPAGDSIVRLPDGATTGSNCNDFSVTATPTPGSNNVAEPQLTITASSPFITYGSAIPAITASYRGFVDGNTAASLPIAPTCTTSATSWSPPGRYPTWCSGAADQNYVIDARSYRAGTLTIAPAVPGKPTDVTARPGNGLAVVTWSAPATNGSRITRYAVISSPRGRTCTWFSGPLTCTVTGLTNGTRYSFTVVAYNSAGAGPASTPSNSVTPMRS